MDESTHRDRSNYIYTLLNPKYRQRYHRTRLADPDRKPGHDLALLEELYKAMMVELTEKGLVRG